MKALIGSSEMTKSWRKNSHTCTRTRSKRVWWRMPRIMSSLCAQPSDARQQCLQVDARQECLQVDARQECLQVDARQECLAHQPSQGDNIRWVGQTLLSGAKG